MRYDVNNNKKPKTTYSGPGNEREINKFGEPDNCIMNDKTRLVDISDITKQTTSGRSTTGKRKTRAKSAAKITLKSVLFIMRKALTYLLNVLLTLLLVGVITGAVVGIAFVIYIKNYIDPEYNGLDNLQYDSDATTLLYYIDREGNEVELKDDALHGSENRLWAEFSTFPDDLIDAYIAVEDMRYWDHNGVDNKRTFSALVNFFIPTNTNYGGGSTITQQLIKNVSGENKTTIQRKVLEIFRALNVEEKFSKEEILEMYLNTIPLSQNTNGVRTAADVYFGKDIRDLDLIECAAIAAIGKSPAKYDPLSHPINNLERRNLVLKLMLEQGKISQEEFDEAYDAPLVMKDDSDTEYTETIHSYYIDAVIDDVIDAIQKKEDCDRTTATNKLYSGGLQIVTCMDPMVQEALEEVFENTADETAGIHAQAAMCVVDPDTGDLLGIVGGRGEKKISRGFNRATQSKRQCGSAIKPLSVYSLALEMGLYTYGSPVEDFPTVYNESSNSYWPPNANGVYRGRVPLTYAISQSLNTIAVSTAQKIGVENVYDNMVNNLGFTTLNGNDDGDRFTDVALSPLALGSFTFGVTTREMTQAYAVFANEGVYNNARTFSLIRDKTGYNYIKDEIEPRIAYSDTTAYIMTSLLFNVISSGTATRYITLNKSFPNLEIAGKTGSTNDNRDVYFCGYTPDYVACCWYGYDNNKKIPNAEGNVSAKLWDAVFKKIYTFLTENGIKYQEKFDVPVSIVKDVSYCAYSGMKPCEACNQDLKVLLKDDVRFATVAKGVFTNSTLPSSECSVHKMVKWDTVTRSVFVDGCTYYPGSNVIDVSLRHIENRSFVKQVKVTDSQYLYYDVPDGYVYPTDPSVPFFQNLIGTGVYIGTSGSNRPYNRVCIEYYNPFSDISDESSDDFEFFD
ncbi:MAG: transglycosylase domain-containing protein [Eubacteriales bacterium]|nr:transglycosylase domain-containing protein [Eubacteriales bacterium]